MAAKKSLCLTYLLWLFGGFFGLHHLYLRRYKQALVWWCLPGGYFGAGWIRDIWRIPEYVRDANDDPNYLKDLTNKMRTCEKPPLSVVRWLGQLLLGNVFGLLVMMATPRKEELGGLDFEWVSKALAPAATALGIWLVGNIGRQTGSIVPPLIACYLATPLQFFGINNAAVTSGFGIIAFHWKSRQWKRTVSKPLPLYKTMLVLLLCGGLYSTLWISYAYFNMTITTLDKDEILVRDAIGNFLKSPAFQEFSKNVAELWHHAWKFGFWSTFQQLIESLDPLGEKNALKVLSLPPGSNQEEIRARYRELTKVWHPDRIKEQSQKAEAHQRFVEIQQAYEKLSDIKNKRAKQNKRTEECVNCFQKGDVGEF